MIKKILICDCCGKEVDQLWTININQTTKSLWDSNTLGHACKQCVKKLEAVFKGAWK